MISVQEAQRIIFSHTPKPRIDSLKIENLHEEILQETLIADRSYPPFHRVAMDGIAIAFQAWADGLREFQIKGCQKAGQPPLQLDSPDGCLEVMTGAVLPTKCDAVIRYEDIEINDNRAHIKTAVKKMQNVHQKGADYQKGEPLLPCGTPLLAPQWAIAASIGKAQVQVAYRPRIAIVSTGDELVGVDKLPEPHQIRRSNSYAIFSMLRNNGFCKVSMTHLKDQPQNIYTSLEMTLKQNDIIILSGGVSMGKFDFVPKILADLKVKKLFHKVRQKPGKPIWFGTTESQQLVFGLPGNPVSALICCQRYVIPALWKSLGINENPNQLYAVLNKDITFKKKFTYFVAAKIKCNHNGTLIATPVSSNGSGDFASLGESSGFLELNEEPDNFLSGSCYPFYSWQGR